MNLFVLTLLLWHSLGEVIEEFIHGHTNNWAIIVSTSVYWLNYRHMANSLSVYRTVKRLGIPDDRIILMIADGFACNPRNVLPGTIFNSADHKLNIYGEDIEVDYRGCDVNSENFIRLLTGRHSEEVPKSKRLDTDDRSNVLIYMSGHGGDGFLKFKDQEEITSFDLADAFGQMWEKKRYNEILFIIDTCQASTLYETFYSPNIIAISSSRRGENSYSHQLDKMVGLPIMDRFTHHLLMFMENVDMQSTATLQDFVNSWRPRELNSNPHIRTDLFSRSPSKIKLTEFFGNVRKVYPSNDPVQITAEKAFDTDSFVPPKLASRKGATRDPAYTIDVNQQVRFLSFEFKLATCALFFFLAVVSRL